MNLFDRNFTILEKGLNAYSTRAEALTNNIANVNTPNYKRQDIQFENIMQEALSDKHIKLPGKVTNRKHIPIQKKPKLDNVRERVITENSTIMRNDRNNVDIEKEQAEFAKNNIRYQFATGNISTRFGLLKSAIKGS